MLESFLLLIPWGKELLLIGLTANRPSWFLYYASVAALGSAGGCFLLDILSRRSTPILSRRLSPAHIGMVERQLQRYGALSLSVAALMPPPFPFTAFLTAAGAFGYPRKKLLGTVAVARFVRFTVVAALAARYHSSILELASEPWLKYALAVVVLVPIIWTAVSFWRARSRASASSL